MYSTSYILLGEATGEAFSRAELLGFVLWGGLGVLTLALLIVMRSRWGQTRPVVTCIVLSVFAHFLLFTYAYGTRMILTVPVEEPPQPATFQVQVVEESKPLDRPLDPETPIDQELVNEQKAWDPVADEIQLNTNVEREMSRPKNEVQVERESVSLVPSLAPDEQLASVAGVNRPNSNVAGEFRRSELPSNRHLAPTQAARIEMPSLPNQTEPAVALRTEQFDSTIGSDLEPSRINELDGIRFDEGLTRQADSLLSRWEQDSSPGSSLPLPGDIAEPVREPLADKANPIRQDSANNQLTSQSVPQIQTDDVQAWLQQLRESPLPRVGDGRPMPEAFRLRVSESRRELAFAQGGTPQSEQAVEEALEWLANHQSSDGRWDSDRHTGGRETRVLGHDRQGAGTEADTGITGLALLAFLSSGHTHLEGDYQETVLNGLQFLLDSQSQDGDLAGNARLFARMYCHGMALLAISEAYAMTGDHRLQPAVEAGLRYTLESQHRSGGGWRYQPGDQGDLSQFGWQVMAIKSCQLAGFAIPESTTTGMERFLRSCLSGTHGGLAAYKPNERPSAAMTAEAAICRIFLELDFTRAAQDEAQRKIIKGLPLRPLVSSTNAQANLRGQGVLSGANSQSNGRAINSNWSGRGESETPQVEPINLYLLYYGTLAMFSTGGERWQTWNEQLQAQLLDTQIVEGEEAGSWNPDTAWGSYGGRVYSTAMAALCLEVYYRYLPLYQLDTKPSAHTARPTVLIPSPRR